MDSFCRRNRHRAVTLLELALVSGFVSMLSVVMFLATRSSIESQRKAGLTQGAQQTVRLAFENLRQELRGARVIEPAVGLTAPQLLYEKVEIANEQIVLSESGSPVWEGPFTISLSEGGVVSSRENRLLGRLGLEGEMVFQRPEERRLVVSLKSLQGDNPEDGKQAESTAVLEIVLVNN